MGQHSKSVTQRYRNGERYSANAKENMRNKNISRFLIRAAQIHGKKFSYPLIKTEFLTQKSAEITIDCRLHGRFSATPDNHLQFLGGKCDECGRAAKSRAAKLRYHKQYLRWISNDLPSHLIPTTDFKDPNDEVGFKCMIHKNVEFHRPIYLKNNKLWGCKFCSTEATRQSLILNLESLKHELSLPENISVIDINREDPKITKILCECKTHGLFKITKGSLKNSVHGCDDCANLERGFAAQRLAKLMREGEMEKPCRIVLLVVDVFGIKSLKIGVTTRTIKDRYGEHVHKIIDEFLTSERVAYTIEKALLKKFMLYKDNRIRAFGIERDSRWVGDTELFHVEYLEEISFDLKKLVSKAY